MDTPFTTGIQALDASVGGGFSPGSLVELYGESGSGKTALALRFVARAQTEERLCAWVATVPPPSPESIRWAGFEPDDLLILPQSPSSPALPGTAHLIMAGVHLVVIDSLSACVSSPASSLLATLAFGLPLVVGTLGEHPALVVVTNQVRTVPGVRTEMPSGQGAALARAVDYRIRLTAGEGIYRGGQLIGQRTNFRVDRTPGPMESWYGEGFFRLYWGEGLRDQGERR